MRSLRKSRIEQFYRAWEAYTNVEQGTPVSWHEPPNTSGAPPVSIRIRRKQDEAGEHFGLLRKPGRWKDAAKEILKNIPKNSSLLEGSKANEKTVRRWFYRWRKKQTPPSA